MSYGSVDAIQKTLASDVFHHTEDRKKAAGRALGTIVELVTFYMLRRWGLLPYLTIELRLPEFGNSDITHNVEFGLHPCIERMSLSAERLIPLTPRKLLRQSDSLAALLSGFEIRSDQLLSRDGLQRNCCVLAKNDEAMVVANLVTEATHVLNVGISKLAVKPFAIVECKRVGIEEGAKKGPTTIEKAKQGAYVANHVSSVQKVRDASGRMYGAIAKPDGGFFLLPYEEALQHMVLSDKSSEFRDFVLTVGIASNHGNWFTSDNPNKELLVLKQSYDWLLFLNDGGLAEFVTDLILHPADDYRVIRDAFLGTYDRPRGERGTNRFTKVRIAEEAHRALGRYFEDHGDRVEGTWLSVLGPRRSTIAELHQQLHVLAVKDWTS